MAPQSFWSGYLKLSLVTCPVAMAPAISEREKVRFHTLNRRTGDRVESRYLDAETGKPVDDEDQVKGYEQSEGDYVILEDEEIENVALESTRTIDIESFVPARSVPWIWYDRPHYLVPDDPVGEEAFSVIRDAMETTGMVGLSRLVLYRRERPVMLEPRDNGIVVWTLRYGNEVREAQPYFSDIEPAKPDRTLLALVGKLIDERTRPWDPSMIQDPVQDKLLDIIAAKRKGKAPRASKARQPPRHDGNVVSIMDALKKSLAAEKHGSRR